MALDFPLSNGLDHHVMPIAMATAPFAAQHFGTVTPWGLVANIIGIPLTGL